MDTYRVELPIPQTVVNEEEFVTNSGRSIKKSIESDFVQEMKSERELLRPLLEDGEDLLSSGLSILSPSPGEDISARDRELSNSVQAELHLSLDRLSENYDRDDIKRMQEKSKQRQILTERRRQQSSQIKTPNSNHSKGNAKIKNNNDGNFSRDSLDEDVAIQNHKSDSRSSAEFIDSDNEDEQTVVADSLNYLSSIEGGTPASMNSERTGIGSTRNPAQTNSPSHSNSKDKYSDLRYNPHWRKVESPEVEVASPIVVDFNEAPNYERLEDSLDQPLISSQRGGGAIVVHKNDIFSPVVPDREIENIPQLPLFSSRSISPTRLSTDPVRLQQTNARYEEEFHKMLEAEVLHNNDQNVVFTKDTHQPVLTPIYDQLETTPTPREKVSSSRKESYPVLVRKIDSQEQRFSSNDAKRNGGYQILPDRHRIPSPSRGPSSQGGISDKPPIIPKHGPGLRRYRSPETFIVDKKDPLMALSPREKHRMNLAPTPPKMPKPKNKDYVEMNKIRLGRKTNSAGYLDLHNKRARQAELVKARSHSELKGSVSQRDYDSEIVRHTRNDDDEYMAGTVEDIWSKQAQRLKVAKGENVIKGKIRRSPRKREEVSPRLRNHQYNDANMTEMEQIGKDAWYSHNQREYVGLDSRLHRLSNRNHQILQHPLPVPSQQVPTQEFSPHGEDLMDSLNESGFRKEYFASRYQHPIMQTQQDSPLMKAQSMKYGDHPAFTNGIENLQQQFSERNLNLQPQHMMLNHVEVWKNPDAEILPPSNYSTTRTINRKVTFLGDNEPVAIEGLANGETLFTPLSRNMLGFNRYKIPLPPTPPSKSQRHTLDREQQRFIGKENVAVQDYYDVREDNYPLLPPILKSHQKTSPLKSSPNSKNIETLSTMHENRGGGYLEQHKKQKKKFQYKKYTLTDYKNLKKDVKLGGLGPDLVSGREKFEKAERAKRYAEIIRKEHMTAAVIKEFPEEENEKSFNNEDNYHFSATMDDERRKGMMEKRKRAMEYSKQIPRPKPKPKINSQVSEDKTSSTSLSRFSSEESPSNLPKDEEGIDFNWGLLQMLKDRHEKEKAQVATFSENR